MPAAKKAQGQGKPPGTSKRNEGEQDREGESSKGPHRMRIASGGHISQYVAFALQFLKEHPDRPLVLHTIPPPPSASAADASPASKPSSTTGLPKSLLATPKLISVVELIKRQYMESLQASGKGKNKAVGIWQYTTSGLLPFEPREGEARQIGLGEVLAGRTKPALRHCPYLEITLSTRPLGLEDTQKDTTCQYAITRHRRLRGTRDAVEEVRNTSKDVETGAVASAESEAKKQKAAPVAAVEKAKAGGTSKKRKVGSQSSTTSAEAGKATKKLKSRG